MAHSTAYIFRDVIDQIERLSEGKAYLFGQWTSTFNPVVHGIYVEGGLSNFRFEKQPVDFLGAKMQLKNNFQLGHIGEVVVSSSGAETLQKPNRRSEGQRYLVLNVSQSSQPLGATLYSENGSSSPYCTIDKLRGKNPFSQEVVKNLSQTDKTPPRERKYIPDYNEKRGTDDTYGGGFPNPYGNRGTVSKYREGVVDYHGNRGTDNRYGCGDFDHYGNRNRTDKVKGVDKWSQRPPMRPPQNDEFRTSPAVARMGRSFEPEAREAETKGDQWYASSGGQEKLRRMHDEVKYISSNLEVEMNRDTITHDMSFIFDYYGAKWEIAYPHNFPAGYLKLKKLTTVGDEIPTTIRKREISEILDEIKDIVRKDSWP